MDGSAHLSATQVLCIGNSLQLLWEEACWWRLVRVAQSYCATLSSRRCLLSCCEPENHPSWAGGRPCSCPGVEAEICPASGAFRGPSLRLCARLCSSHRLGLVCLPNDPGVDMSLGPCRTDLDSDPGSDFGGGPWGHLDARGRDHGRGPVYRHGDFLGFLQEMVSAMFCGEPSSSVFSSFFLLCWLSAVSMQYFLFLVRLWSKPRRVQKDRKYRTGTITCRLSRSMQAVGR